MLVKALRLHKHCAGLRPHPIRIASVHHSTWEDICSRICQFINIDGVLGCFFQSGLSEPGTCESSVAGRRPSIRRTNKTIYGPVDVIFGNAGTCIRGRLGRLLFSRLVIDLGEVRVDDIFFVVVRRPARIARVILRLRGDCFIQLD